jgi:hypothetical protein
MAKQRHSESGRTKAQRRQHDRREKHYEEATTQQWHQSPGLRVGMMLLVVVAVIGLTGLFVAGVIKW